MIHQRQSAAKIAWLVNEGTLKARDIALDIIERLKVYDKVQPQTFISRQPNYELLALAETIDERIKNGEVLPLAGVPFAVKDNIDVLGFETTAGCKEFAYKPQENAYVVQKLLDAGALCVGKTNLDQFATGLVGVRSPYGAPRCVYNLEFVSGGSSSGSAVAVAAGIVAFALGTDTAGSGRVPAAFNHLIGLKPTKGRYSIEGLVPACKSLDCISIFTNDADDAKLIDNIMAGYNPKDAFSCKIEKRKLGQKVGVPKPQQMQFFGDVQSEFLYAQALEKLKSLQYELVEIDIDFLSKTAQLLYNGPWVCERTAAIEDLIKTKPETIEETVREIIAKGLEIDGIEVFKGQYQLQEYSRMAQKMWREIDMLCLPTCPTIYRVKELKAAPIALNSNLGFYTNFVNLLDMAAIAVPSGFRENGTGFGITFIGPRGSDLALIDVADGWIKSQDFKVSDLDLEGKMDKIKLAVVGAHLEGMPLHWQLTSRDAKFIESTTTAKSYKLYAIANSTPPKPALIFDEKGEEIAVEIYEISAQDFGTFTAEVPPPLAIGTVTLKDGSMVKGFVAEPRALDGATEITQFGGWRAYIKSLQV